MVNCAFNAIVFRDAIFHKATNSTIAQLDAVSIIMHDTTDVRIENAIISSLIVPENSVNLMNIINKSEDLTSSAPFDGLNFS